MKIAGVIASLVIALGCLIYLGCGRPTHLQKELCDRASDLIRRGNAHCPPGVDQHDWSQCLIMLGNTIPNRFLPGYCPLDRVQELVRQFEARWPDGPRSLQDILDMTKVMEKVHPNYGNYSYDLRYSLWAEMGFGDKPEER